jgi:hypothetical protein
MTRWMLIAAGLAGLAVLSFALPPQDGPDVPASIIFQLKGSGKIAHYHGAAGSKAFKTGVKMSQVAACIVGTAAGCSGNISTDSGGTAYLKYVSTTTFHLDTETGFTDPVVLTGLVGTDGRFHMTGTDVSSVSNISLDGKVKYQSDKTTAKSIRGKLRATSASQGHMGKGKFKSSTVVTP